MRRLLKLECKKSFCNRWFAAALAIGVILACVSAYEPITFCYDRIQYFETLIIRNTPSNDGLEAVSLYRSWLGVWQNLGSYLFYYLVPLMALLPSALNITEEIHSGYLKVIVPRVGRRKYFAAKLTAAFLSGGAVVTASLLFSLALMAAFLPAVQPHPYNSLYYSVSHGELLSAFAYGHPLLYALLYILVIDFVFAGLFACLSLVVALRSGNRLAVLALPYLAVILCDGLDNFLLYICYIEISPLKLMWAVQPSNFSRAYVLLGWYGIFAAVILIGGYRKGVHRELV